MIKILIMGLPSSGKSSLAEELAISLISKNKTVDWFNADEVRAENDDWDFSLDGRLRQATRMKHFADSSIKDFVICDFIAPLGIMRDLVSADFVIWVDTSSTSQYENTNNLFRAPTSYDVKVTDKDAKKWTDLILKKLLTDEI